MFYLTMYSIHFIYGYIASGIWITRGEVSCFHFIDYTLRLAARTVYRWILHSMVFITPVVEHWLDQKVIGLGLGAHWVQMVST